MAISHCYWHLVVKNANWQIYCQMHHGIYIMGCFWWPFWILQEKVGISLYFWIIRLANSTVSICTVMSDVTPPLKLSWLPQNLPQMTITNLNYEGSYLPGVICNIFVKGNIGRWTPQTNPKLGRWTYFGWWKPPNASWDIYYGMYLATMLDSSRKGGNFLLFLNN